MLQKISFGAICVIGLTFFSCNGNEEKKKDVSSNTTTNIQVAEAPIVPANELAMLEKKFEQDSLNFELRSVLAANYYSSGILDKAAYHFLRVYEHDNKNLIALSDLGNIYYDGQQFDNAIKYYEKALELDPKNINMKCDLATCYMNINKLNKAIDILNENIKQDYNHSQSHYNLSVILKKTGKTAEAEEEMKVYDKLKSGGK
ncbi:MAG: tetratricopeptide repeat protein [Bacteroidetes bacterium]|nr:tetratricopeptide repeat protein [Bacteroidota bacterium]